MSRVAIATDTNSGITIEEAKQLGVFSLPMCFFINDKKYFECIDLTQEDFYKIISDPKVTVATTQPSPGELEDFWNSLLKEHDEVVYIPMSSGLSSSCGTAKVLADEHFSGKVHVVDNHRISITQYQSAIDAKILSEQGKTGLEIKKELEANASNSSIYIMVNNLSYLKRGGRITAAGAIIASVMSLKPVLQIQGEKLDAFSKCRGIASAKKSMIDAMKNDFENRFKEFVDNKTMSLHIAYSDMTEDEVNNWYNEVKEAFPEYEIHAAPLSLSIGCHIGPGSLAIACANAVTKP